MIRVGVIGGAGFVAGELLRLLVNHPQVVIAFVQSNSQEGEKVSSVHSDLFGELEMTFTNDLKDHPEVDLLYLCGGHGKSKEFLSNHHVPERVKLVDLSRDFRLIPEKQGFVYGLPELNKTSISGATKIANPGCFATCIQLGLLPLAANNLLQYDVHIHALTGSTGAGALPVSTTHFSWRNNNVSMYKAFRHQHLDEIKQGIKQLQPNMDSEINFLPIRGNFTRGIYSSIYTRSELSQEALFDLYRYYYEDHPFTLITHQDVNLKQVVNTNKCLIQIQKIDNKVLIISMIDNLLKGASGQAVQNMNVMFGLTESLGLNLKAAAF